MKYAITIILILLTLSLFAARNASTVIHFTIPDIQQITLNDANLTLNLSYSGGGENLYEPMVINSTYNIVSTGSMKRLIAQLNQNMPVNSSLEVKVDAPANAISLDYVELSATPVPVVTNISNVNQQNLLMYYRLKANLGSPVTVNDNRVVTFTIMD